MINNNTSRLLVLIIGLGFLLRVLYAFSLPDVFNEWPDSQQYLSIARNVAAHFEYVNSWQPPRDIPRFGDTGLTAYREPFYPLFLALNVKVFGESPRAILVIHAML